MPRRYPFVTLALCVVMIAASWVVVDRPPVARAADFVLTVNTTSDVYPSDGVCSAVADGCTLRDALEVADTQPVSSTVRIEFHIPSNDPGRQTTPDPITGIRPWFIRPVTSYNFITRDNMTIDGYTQEQRGQNNPTGPILVIDGSNLNASLSSSGSAFVFSGSNNTITDIAIINYKTVSAGSNSFDGIAIELTIGANNNTIQGCYIGIDAFGRSAAPNTIGILIRSNGNTIGGDRTINNLPNIISGNVREGILIDGSPPPASGDATSGANNKIYGNNIGLNNFGTMAIGNGGSGIFIRRGSGNLIGIPDSPSKNNSVERNTISGNGEHGILIQDSKSNKIYGNFIGTDSDGTDAIGNTRDGIHIESTGGAATGNLIGGRTNPYMRNTISGNGQYGVRLQGDNTKNTVIQSNRIGPADSGFALGGSFTQAGIRLDTGPDGTLIGGSTGPSGLLPGHGNLIAGNKGDALVVDGRPQQNFVTTTDGVTIQGNNIGVSEPSGVTGAQNDLPNQGQSLIVDSARNVTIGGTTDASGNVVGNSTGAGIDVTSVLSLTVSKNAVGLKRSANINQGGTGGYTVGAANNGDGIYVYGASNLRLESNLVGANTGNGISLTIVQTTTLRSNQIGGISAPNNRTYSLPNGALGLRVVGVGSVTSDLVSARTTLDGNKVLYNSTGGVRLTNTYTSTLTNNTINLNSGIGVLVDGGGYNTQINGGTVYSNTVGVQVGLGTKRVKITTSISGNGVPLGTKTYVGDNRKAIILSGSVPVDGSDSGPNHDIDTPTNLRMNQAGRLTGQIRLPAKNQPPTPGSCVGCTLRFYTPNPLTRDGQGRDELTGIATTIDASGYFTATLSKVPSQVVVTATDADGNTSEPAVFTPNYQPLQIGPPRSGTASPGQTVSYTHWITNTGNIDLDDIQIATRSTRQWATATVPPFAGQSLSLRGLGGSRAITLTVTLPGGGNPSAWAGNVDQSAIWAHSTSVPTATATVTDTTTVIGKFILKVTPEAPTALGLPGSTVSQAFNLQNTGNLTGTATVTATSFLVGPGGTLFSAEATRAAGWTTALTPTNIPLIPGQSRGSTIFIGVPKNAQSGQQVVTRFAVTVTSPAPASTYYYTATTTVADKIQISLFPSRAGDGAADVVTTFEHTVINLGNTTLQLKLTGTSSLGSNVTFRSKNQSTFPLGPDGTFTLGTGSNGTFNFYVDVRVNQSALRGQQDLITINVLKDGTSLSGIQDTITVTRGAIFPRIYLPVARK